MGRQITIRIAKAGHGQSIICKEDGQMAEVIQINSMEGPSRFTAYDMVGQRVVRGPDWRWGEQDYLKGQPCQGLVLSELPPGRAYMADYEELLRGETVVVLWDNGHDNAYRYGAEGAYDVIRVDDAPQPSKCQKAHQRAQALQEPILLRVFHWILHPFTRR